MANERWQLHTGADLDAEAGEAEGLVNPPLTVAARLAARPATYGDPVVPTAPKWYTNPTGTAVSGGQTNATSFSIAWRSDIGDIPPGSKQPGLPPVPETKNEAPTTGSAGVDGLGVAGHYVYIGVGAAPGNTPSLVLLGPRLNTVVSGFWTPAAPPPEPPPEGEDAPAEPEPTLAAILPAGSVWAPVLPQHVYQIQIAAFNADGVAGPKSDILTVTTLAATAMTPPYFTPPNPPGGFTYDPDQNLPDPDVTPLPGFFLIWDQVRGATSYEIYTNTSKQTAIAMDPTRPGLMVGDVLAGTAIQPTEPGPVRFTTPAVTADTTYVIKVRSVRTGTDPVSGQPVTAYSPFAPALRYYVPETDTIVPPPRPAKKTAAKTTSSGS